MIAVYENVRIIEFFYLSINVVGQDASSREEPSSTAPTSTTTSPAQVELSGVHTIFAGINRPYSVTPPMAEGIEAQLKEIELQASNSKDAVKVSLAPKTTKNSTPTKEKSSTPVSKKTTSKLASKAPQRQIESKKGRPLQDALRSLFSNGNSRLQQPSVNSHAIKTSHKLSRSRKPLNLGAE